MKLVRDGKLVAPYCNECGCRLEQTHGIFMVLLKHFSHPRWEQGKDAREHPCSLWAAKWTVARSRVYSPKTN